jgi:hypothetical protein
VKTVRFSEVVKRCGAPESHLALIAPAKDKPLQTAIKANRLMTVFQQNVGTKTDFGMVGFEEGSSRQYLIFPKSLRPFTGRKVVGIKYELLSTEEIPASERAPAPKPPKPAKPARLPEAEEAAQAPKSQPRRTPADGAKPASVKVVEFRPPHDDDEEEALRQIKRLARQAMKALEDGKHVAAFQILRRIVAM